MSSRCLYMPRDANTLRGKAQLAFRAFSYACWRREIRGFIAREGSDRRLRIVEVGCGPGFLLKSVETWFPAAELTGVDANPELLKVVTSRCARVKTVQADACVLPLRAGSVDMLFALHVVEHLPNPEQLLLEARRALAPRGLLVVATPNLGGLGAKLMGPRWQGYKDPTHISLNNASWWRQTVQDAGFAIRRDGTTGLTGLPLFNKMPLGLTHWIPSFVFGHFPWKWGEAYVCVAQRPGD